MELHKTDYQRLNLLYSNLNLLDINAVTSINKVREFDKNKKYLLAVLCVTETNDTLNDNDKAQLERILLYLKESFDTIPVFTCNKENPITFAQLNANVKFNTLLIFGGTRKLQALNIDTVSGYMPIKMYDVTLFFVHSLSVLENDGAKKKQLAEMLNKQFTTT
jgi:hypothetical protein